MLIIDEYNNITLTRGDTAYIDLSEFFDYDGDTYYLQQGDKIYFRLRTPKQILTKELEINTGLNMATLTINPEDTIPFAFGDYRYEMELVTVDNEHFTFIADKRFTVDKEQEVHRNGS